MYARTGGVVTSTIDTIRALFTYVTALIIVVGGGLIIYGSRSEPAAADVVAIVAGFMGAALTFLFSSETQTRTARQTSTASEGGAMQHANGYAARAAAGAAEGRTAAATERIATAVEVATDG
jgi:hypothetical protein